MFIFKELVKVFRINKNIFYLILITILVFFIFRVSPFFISLWDFLFLKEVSFSRFFEYFWEVTILSIKSDTIGVQFLAFIFPPMVALNLILFKIYYQKQKDILKSKSFFSSMGFVFLGFFGVGCGLCSGVIFAPLIALVGLSSFFDWLPYKGGELAYIGLLFIIIFNIYILKKFSKPNICFKK